jgi:hypothetical protein
VGDNVTTPAAAVLQARATPCAGDSGRTLKQRTHRAPQNTGFCAFCVLFVPVVGVVERGSTARFAHAPLSRLFAMTIRWISEVPS